MFIFNAIHVYTSRVHINVGVHLSYTSILDYYTHNTTYNTTDKVMYIVECAVKSCYVLSGNTPFLMDMAIHADYHNHKNRVRLFIVGNVLLHPARHRGIPVYMYVYIVYKQHSCIYYPRL